MISFDTFQLACETFLSLVRTLILPRHQSLSWPEKIEPVVNLLPRRPVRGDSARRLRGCSSTHAPEHRPPRAPSDYWTPNVYAGSVSRSYLTSTHRPKTYPPQHLTALITYVLRQLINAVTEDSFVIVEGCALVIRRRPTSPRRLRGKETQRWPSPTTSSTSRSSRMPHE